MELERCVWVRLVVPPCRALTHYLHSPECSLRLFIPHWNRHPYFFFVFNQQDTAMRSSYTVMGDAQKFLRLNVSRSCLASPIVGPRLVRPILYPRLHQYQALAVRQAGVWGSPKVFVCLFSSTANVYCCDAWVVRSEPDSAFIRECILLLRSPHLVLVCRFKTLLSVHLVITLESTQWVNTFSLRPIDIITNGLLRTASYK